MADSIEIEIIIDDTDLEEAKEDIKEYEETSTKLIDKVNQETQESFNKVLAMARGSYLVALGTLKIFGGSVSYMFRSMISGMFTTITALKAIALGKAMTTMDWISFGLEMGQLGLSLAATIAAEEQQMELGRSLMGAKMGLMGISQLIGNMYFI